MNNLHSAAIIAVCAAVTILLRFIPFLIFQNRELPSFIIYLGKVLPYSVMAMLVVYCLKNIQPFNFPFGLPEIICCGLTAFLQVKKRNTLLSIVAGTVLYMLLVQRFFV